MERLRAWALALGLGASGGFLFAWANLPLPWMLGAMAACTAAALSGARPAVPRPLRSGMIAVLGVMLGSAFTPGLAARLPEWSLTLAILSAAMAVTTWAVARLFRRLGGHDPVTAYFAAAPGGINEMVLTGGALGGDERAIALSHALRILLIVFTVPFGFRMASNWHGTPIAQAMGSIADLHVADALLLAACAVAGALAARMLRFPAPGLTGPMAASAAIHLGGLTASAPPGELVVAAQVVTGAAIGSRFAGLSLSALAASARLSTMATLVMLAVSGGAAFVLALGTGLSFPLLLLAFVPGGIAEMCLVALALGQDVAFVSTHHVVRVVLVIAVAPLAFRLLRGRGGQEP
jgi:membrane AbrB-like protein